MTKNIFASTIVSSVLSKINSNKRIKRMAQPRIMRVRASMTSTSGEKEKDFQFYFDCKENKNLFPVFFFFFENPTKK